MISASHIAKRICDLSDWSMTNLHLQHQLYMMQVLYYGENEGCLVKEKFEACRQGIVVPSLYLDLKVFGEKPIERYKFKTVPEITDERLQTFVEKSYAFLKSYTPAQLEKVILRDDGAWRASYVQGLSFSPVSEYYILRDFNTLSLGQIDKEPPPLSYPTERLTLKKREFMLRKLLYLILRTFLCLLLVRCFVTCLSFIGQLLKKMVS